MKKVILIFFILSGFFSDLSAQSVNLEFSEALLKENFDNNNNSWPIFTNRENFFLIQKGYYNLERKSAENQYAIFPPNIKDQTLCSIQCSFKVEGGQDSYAGLIFMAQVDGQGGFFIEISGAKKYRIKQLSGNNFQLLTGDISNQGWVKSPLINKDFNEILIKVKGNKADIYINSAYLSTIGDPGYKAGRTGLLIGPKSNATIDYFNILIPSHSTAKEPDKGTLVRDSLNLFKRILIDQNNQIQSLKKEKDSLLLIIDQLQSKQLKPLPKDSLK